MLKEKGIPCEFREYRKEPLSQDEIRKLMKMMSVSPVEVLRTRDRAFTELDLTGEESADRLIALMSEHPTLLQRPIGVYKGRAVMGRPVERLLELLETRPG